MVSDQRPYWTAAERLLGLRWQRKWGSFSWITARALLSSINDTFSRQAPTLVAELRAQWMAQVASTGPLPPDLVIDRSDCSDFIILGDPGEQDASQYVVVPALEQALIDNPGIGLMVICSDVIYPSGDVNDYVDGFYIPYQGLQSLPTYALPGNHDWYDGLAGFMWHWCDQERLPSAAYGPSSGLSREWLARLFWRRPSKPSREQQLVMRRQIHRRGAHATLVRLQAPATPGLDEPLQRTPYFAIQTAHVLLVCIDTGIDGNIDTPQGQWLLDISCRPGPKLLVTGKPLLVNKSWHECRITTQPVTRDGRVYSSVGEVVEDPEHGYVATVGGDIHNFQQYERHGRPHVVSGGGGAFMSATHTISEAALSRPPAEREAGPITSSPTEAESLSHFADLMLPRLWRLQRALLAALTGAAVAETAWFQHQVAGRTLHEGALALAGLVAVRAVLWPSRWTRSHLYRATLVAVSLLAGALMTMTAQRLIASPGTADDVVRSAFVLVGGLALTGQALRWTAWWRPAPTREAVQEATTDLVPPGPAPSAVRRFLRPNKPTSAREDQWKLSFIGVLLLALAVVVGLRRHDPWLVGAVVLTEVVWALGAWVFRRPVDQPDGTQRPRTGWRTWGVLTAYAVLTLDALVALDRTLVAGHAVWVVTADVVGGLLALLLVALAVLCVLIAVAALVFGGGRPTPLAQTSATIPHPQGRLRTGWGRVGMVAPWVYAVLVLAGIVAGCLWWPQWGPAGSALAARRAAVTVAALTLGGASLPLLVDALRRHFGRRYKLVGCLVVALAAAGLVRWGVFPHWVLDEVLAVLAAAGGLAVALAVTNLVIVGAPAMAVDLRSHWDIGSAFGASDSLIPVPQAQRVLDWRLGRPGEDPRPHLLRRADVVSPGADQPQGPLQKAVSEVFDSDRPPFFKNFVVVTSSATSLDLSVVIVTGTDGAPDPVQIPVQIPVRIPVQIPVQIPMPLP